MNCLLTFVEGKSSKFYSLTVEDRVLTIRFGRIGSLGQEKVTTHATAAEALAEYQSLYNQKVKKGYVLQPAEPETAPPAQAPVAPAAAPPVAPTAAPPVAPAAAASAAEAGGSAAPLAAAAPAVPGEAAVASPTGPGEDTSTVASSPPAIVPAPGRKKGRAASDATAAPPPVVTCPPPPALADPEVPGLDLDPHRPGPLPVPERDATPPAEGALVIAGYTITLDEDEALVIADARGKKLKNPPDKLRRHEDWQALMRGRKDDRFRGRRASRILEERMLTGAWLAAEELAWLAEDDAFSPLLDAVLVLPEGRSGDAGLLVRTDPDRGLGLLPLDYDARWIGWQSVELAHPLKLGNLTPWQDLLVDLGLQQQLVQIFREIKTLPAAQRNLTESTLLAGRESRSGSVIERELMDDGWLVRRGMARRKLSVQGPTGLFTGEAWFDYGEYYMPGEPTTSGAFGFRDPATGRGLKFDAVPAVLVSETIRSLELCLARAGARADAEE